MSIDQTRTEAVYAVIQQLFSDGKTAVRPGDVADVFRARNEPIPVWQLRADFTLLESMQRIVCEQESGDWFLTENASLKDAG